MKEAILGNVRDKTLLTTDGFGLIVSVLIQYRSS